MRVLVVEDFEPMARAIATGLRREGMAVDTVGDGSEALGQLAVTRYDVVVLDRDLPGVHGDEVCRRLSAERCLSRILMLTAAGRLTDRVEGLNLGADDYLAKPFDFPELTARVRALARRAGGPLPPVLQHADIKLDSAGRTASRAGRRLTLSAKEFAVLEYLLACPGQVVSAEELLERVWDEAADPFTTAVKQTMHRLRAKLGDPPDSERGLEHPEPVDLADVSRQVVLERSDDAGRRGVRLSAALAAAPVTGDPHLAASLIANLVDNAVRHNVPGGHAEITTTLTKAGAAVTVSNSGPHIPLHAVADLFQPFRQLGAERIRHGEGHGLGLAIVRAIADAHGAAVTAAPRPEGGLDIVVTFP